MAEASRLLAMPIVVTLALMASGCTTSTELGGVWRTAATAQGPLIGTTAAPVAVELVLGHYGPDVSGLLRFYGDDGFELPNDATAPHFRCGCIFVHNGRWSESGARLSFQTRGCLPGQNANASVLAETTLLLEGGELHGAMTVVDPASPLIGTTQPLRVTRFAAFEDGDLRCEAYVDPATGNGANGQ
jgi:hypothetical protein